MIICLSGPKADDSFIAIIILAVALVIVITGAVYAYANRYKLGLVTIRLICLHSVRISGYASIERVI